MENHHDATGYLKEWASDANTPKWLSITIQQIISTQQPLDNEEIEKVYTLMLEENNLFKKQDEEVNEPELEEVIEEDVERHNESEQKLTLKSLSNIQGVNALADDQVLPFSPNLSIIYGLNASGKTGYFRTLHAISGRKIKGRAPTVLGNVSNTEESTKSCTITYSTNDSEKVPITWNGEYGLAPFDRLEVFDREFAALHLQQKDNEFVVSPFKTNLFGYVRDVVQQLETKMNAATQGEAVATENLKLHILTGLSEEGVWRTNIENLGEKTKSEKDQLVANCTWDTADQEELDKTNEQLEELVKKMAGANSSALDTKIGDLQSVVSILKNANASLSASKKTEVEGLISEYNGAKGKLKEATDALDALQKIPGSDSIEWKEFIKAAHRYHTTLADEVKPPAEGDTCLYCGQLLEGDALDRVQQYHTWITSKAQKTLEDAAEKIRTVTTTLEQVSLSLGNEEDVKRIKRSLGDQLFAKVSEYLDSLSLCKEIMVNALKNKTIWEEITIPESSPQEAIETALSQAKEQLKTLNSSTDAQAKEKNRLRAIKNNLEDKQKIAKKVADLNKLVTNIAWLEIANDIKFTSIKTRCSTLHTKAVTDLPGGEFKDTRFPQELKDLGGVRHAIKISIHSSEDESSKRAKALSCYSGGIEDVLSEGEQKVVALADYFAELSMKEHDFPLIVDDPVTSLDEQRMEQVAKRIVTEAKKRQVVVFTHSRAFAFSLLRQLRWREARSEMRNNKSESGCAICWDRGIPLCKKNNRCHSLLHISDGGGLGSTGIVHDGAPWDEDVPTLIQIARESLSKGDVRRACDDLKYAVQVFIDQVVLAGLRSKYAPEEHGIDWPALSQVRPLTKEERLKLSEVWNFANGHTHLSERGGGQPPSQAGEHIETLENLYNNCQLENLEESKPENKTESTPGTILEIYKKGDAPIALEDFQKEWPNVLKAIVSPATRLSLKTGTIQSLEEENVVMSFASSFHHGKLNDPEKIAAVEEIMERIYQRKLKLTLELATHE